MNVTVALQEFLDISYPDRGNNNDVVWNKSI